MVMATSFGAVGERRATDRRGAGVDDTVEETPAVELEDAAAHQGVGREGVGAVAGAVDDEDAQPVAGEEHGGGGAGGAGADDDSVIGGRLAVHRRCPGLTGGWRVAGDVLGDEGGVAADAVDAVRAAEVLDPLPRHVRARGARARRSAAGRPPAGPMSSRRCGPPC